MSGFFYWLFVKSVQPDSPGVARAKNAWEETKAFAQLSNLVLPEPKGK